MVDEYISRKVLKELFDGIHDCADLVFEPDDQICSKQYSSCGSCRWIETKRAIQKRVLSIPAADVRPVPDGGIGEMSDGYHTFNGLYYQRMMLFAALVKAYKDRAWKSLRHEDGELCFGGGWFIVGIDTPQGSYTYHYEGKDFDLFECEELPVAKHWDGHTEEDVTRLLSLHDAQSRWIPVTERLPEDGSLVGKLIADSDGNIRIASQCAEITLSGGKTVYTDLIDLVSFLAEDTPTTEWEDCTHITHWMQLPELPEEE